MPWLQRSLGKLTWYWVSPETLPPQGQFPQLSQAASTKALPFGLPGVMPGDSMKENTENQLHLLNNKSYLKHKAQKEKEQRTLYS